MKKLMLLVLAAALAINSAAAGFTTSLSGRITAAQLVLTGTASAGTADNPVISLSYLTGTIVPGIQTDANTYIGGQMDRLYADFFYRAAQLVAGNNLTVRRESTGQRLTTGSVRLKRGDTLVLDLGSSFYIESGSAKVNGYSLSNVTDGTALDDGDWAPVQKNCMASGEGCGFTVQSETIQLSVSGGYALTASAEPDYNSTADALYTLGLFRGDSTGYALERAATRTEGLVMFIRLLGQEDEALAYAGSHPFTDVASWADRYVAYAYYKGYTKGVSGTLFGADNTVTAKDYLTFLLRALGYAEGTDFNWNTAPDNAVGLGLINAAEEGVVTQSFLRCHLAYISYYSLYANVSGTNKTLLQKLEGEGTVSDPVRAAAKVVGYRIGT